MKGLTKLLSVIIVDGDDVFSEAVGKFLSTAFFIKVLCLICILRRCVKNIKDVPQKKALNLVAETYTNMVK